MVLLALFCQQTELFPHDYEKLQAKNTTDK